MGSPDTHQVARDLGIVATNKDAKAHGSNADDAVHGIAGAHEGAALLGALQSIGVPQHVGSQQPTGSRQFIRSMQCIGSAGAQGGRRSMWGAIGSPHAAVGGQWDRRKPMTSPEPGWSPDPMRTPGAYIAGSKLWHMRRGGCADRYTPQMHICQPRPTGSTREELVVARSLLEMGCGIASAIRGRLARKLACGRVARGEAEDHPHPPLDGRLVRKGPRRAPCQAEGCDERGEGASSK